MTKNVVNPDDSKGRTNESFRRRGRDITWRCCWINRRVCPANDALQKVKRIYNANCWAYRCVDPLATGMLPICLGEATKFSQYLLDSDKRYRVIARLGQRTDTSDADGQIVEERPVTFSAEQLAAALDTFRGDIEQIPSMYSALKYQGKNCTNMRVRALKYRVKRARLPFMNCCLFATKAMSWSWKFTAQKALISAPSLMTW